jgi:hypothetical protein
VTQGENLEKQVSTRRQGRSECSNHQNGGTHRLKNGRGPRSGQRVCPDSILARDRSLEPIADRANGGPQHLERASRPTRGGLTGQEAKGVKERDDDGRHDCRLSENVRKLN